MIHHAPPRSQSAKPWEEAGLAVMLPSWQNEDAHLGRKSWPVELPALEFPPRFSMKLGWRWGGRLWGFKTPQINGDYGWQLLAEPHLDQTWAKTSTTTHLNSFHPYSKPLSWILLYYHVTEGQGASMSAHIVKNTPAIQETQVRSLGQEYALEKGMATHLSIFTWGIPWTEESGGL